MTDEVVENSAEPTATTESTPVETTAEQVTEEAPVGETTDSEKVSKAVPYERFKEVNDKVKQLEEVVASMYQKPQEPQAPEDVPFLDPQAQVAVDNRVSAIVAQQRVAEFQAKHATELKKDPLLQATIESEMRKQNAQGQPIMPEKAYEDAKALIESRIQTKTDEAKQEGVKEGQDIAKTKQQLSAVGETGKIPEVSDDDLSSSEIAKKYNLPRVD